MHCEECGAEVEKLFRFCPQCGTPIHVESGMVFCPHCSAQVRDTARFCPHCGKILSSEKYDEYLRARASDLEKKAAENTRNLQAYLELGHLYRRLGMIEEARQNFEAVIAQEPSGDVAFDAYYSLGRILSEDFDNLNSLDKSVRLLGTAMDLKPLSDEARRIGVAIERLEHQIERLKTQA